MRRLYRHDRHSEVRMLALVFLTFFSILSKTSLVYDNSFAHDWHNTCETRCFAWYRPQPPVAQLVERWTVEQSEHFGNATF